MKNVYPTTTLALYEVVNSNVVGLAPVLSKNLRFDFINIKLIAHEPSS
jgi:hypothetical protein